MNSKIFILLLALMPFCLRGQNQTRDSYTWDIDEMPVLKQCVNETNPVECTKEIISKIFQDQYENLVQYDLSKNTYITFEISEHGEMMNVYVHNNAKFEEIVNNFPEFIPAKKEGKNVCTLLTIIINNQDDKLSVGEYEVLQQGMPFFSGCEQVLHRDRKDCTQENMLAFVMERLECTKKAESKNISGKCVVRFKVGKDGYVKDATIVKRVGYGLDENLKQVVEMMPRWNPGYQKGKPVAVFFNLPVTFNCTKD